MKMGLITKIYNRLKKTKDQRIERAVKNLIKELEPYYKVNDGVNSVYIFYDYTHERNTTIELDCNHSNYKRTILTNELNKNYKP